MKARASCCGMDAICSKYRSTTSWMCGCDCVVEIKWSFIWYNDERRGEEGIVDIRFPDSTAGYRVNFDKFSSVIQIRGSWSTAAENN